MDDEAQAATLTAAAHEGAPFCEECAKADAEEAAEAAEADAEEAEAGDEE